MVKNIKNLDEMKDFASFVAGNLKKDSRHAVILGLFGDLGSGKTTFTQNLANVLGVKQIVTSPTFVIEKIYKLPQQNKSVKHPVFDKNKFKHLVHIDAYRLESGEELKDLGWEEISKDKDNLIVIEWPEKIIDILPRNINRIYFKFIDQNTREVLTKNTKGV